MSFVRVNYEELDEILSQVKECEGESPITIRLDCLLRYASGNEEPVYLSAEDLEGIESYL
jgi:hypothetical protein